jgi:hypothetical protein
MTFPNARDCEHGRQRGKCHECDAAADMADLTAALEKAESETRSLRDEVKRMRHRIECLRGGLKSAGGWLLDADDLKGHEKCLEMAGDMEPPIMGSNAKSEGAEPLLAKLPLD